MISQLSLFIIILFLAIIGVCSIILIFATPSAIKEYSQHIKSTQQAKLNPKGDKGLSLLMEELSRCTSSEKINKIIGEIHTELENMPLQSSVILQSKTDSVTKWLAHFSADQHIQDIKKLTYSRQIKFDSKTKDFKLMIVNK